MGSEHLPNGKLRDILKHPGYTLKEWPHVDQGELNEMDRENFVSRREAVHMYADGSPGTEIRKTTGVRIDHLVRLIRDRCLRTHDDGRIYGYRGLLPYFRIKAYSRKLHAPRNISAGGHAAGAFDQLLRRFPNLACGLQDRFFKKKKKNHSLLQSREQLRHLHAWFIEECRRLGLEERNEYPFNTTTRGYLSIARYAKKLLNKAPLEGAAAVFGTDTALRLKTGDGSARPVTKVFQRVECDANKIDAIFCVLVPSIFGELIPKIVHRIWIIAIKEVLSGCILGYHLSLNYECNQFDLLKAIRHALSLPKKRDLKIPKISYCDGAGFPSNASDHFIGACWDEMSVDGAMINQCKTVVSVMEKVVGATITVIPRRSPNDRPFIERFFLSLAQAGYHRLPNTTGSNLKDGRRSDPEKVAVQWELQLEHLEELTEVLVANYNATPHSSLGHRTPLEYLLFLAPKGRHDLRMVHQTDVATLLNIRKSVKVNGGISKGRRPYIEFLAARYSSDVLGRSYHLVGKRINIIVNEEELRTVEAYHLDGTPIGILRAAPPWHRTPHSLLMRKTVNALKSRKAFHLSASTDPVLALIDYVESSKIDKKKKVPPAYLEARRILVDNVDELREWESRTPQDDLDIERGSSTNFRDQENFSGQKSEKQKNLREAIASGKNLPSRRKIVQ